MQRGFTENETTYNRALLMLSHSYEQFTIQSPLILLIICIQRFQLRHNAVDFFVKQSQESEYVTY